MSSVCQSLGQLLLLLLPVGLKMCGDLPTTTRVIRPGSSTGKSSLIGRGKGASHEHVRDSWRLTAVSRSVKIEKNWSEMEEEREREKESRQARGQWQWQLQWHAM